MYLIDFQFANLPALTSEITQRHREHLAQAYESGELLFGGPKSPRTGGIIISRHSSRDDLEILLQSDPIIRLGLASYTIVEFTPVLMAQDMIPIIDQQVGP